MRRRKSVKSAGKTAEEVASSALISASITHMEVKMQVLSAQMQNSWSSHLQLLISNLNLVEPTYGFSLSVKIINTLEEPDSVPSTDSTSKNTNWLQDPLQFSFKRKQKKSVHESTRDSNEENIDADSTDTINRNCNTKVFSSSDNFYIKPLKKSPLLANFSDTAPLITKYPVSLTPKSKHEVGLMNILLGSKTTDNQKLNSRNLELKLAASLMIPQSASRIQLLVSPVDLTPYVQQLMLLKHAKVAKTKSSKNGSTNESSMDVEILIPFDLPDHILNSATAGRKNLFGYPKSLQQSNDQIKPETMSTLRVRLQLQLVSQQQQCSTMSSSYSNVVRARANLQPLTALSLARSMGMRKLNSTSVDTDTLQSDLDNRGTSRTTSQVSENKESRDPQSTQQSSPTPGGYFSPPVFSNPSPIPRSSAERDHEPILTLDPALAEIVAGCNSDVGNGNSLDPTNQPSTHAEDTDCDYSLKSLSSITVPNNCRQRVAKMASSNLSNSNSSGEGFVQIFLGRGDSLNSTATGQNNVSESYSLQHPSGSSLSSAACSGDSEESSSNCSRTIVRPDGPAARARSKKQSQQPMVASGENNSAAAALQSSGSRVSIHSASPMAEETAETHSEVLSSSLSLSPMVIPPVPPSSLSDAIVQQKSEDLSMSINANNDDMSMRFSRASSILPAPNGLAWFAESLSPHSSPPSQMILRSSSDSPSKYLQKYVAAVSSSKPGKTVLQEKIGHPDPVSPSPGPWPSHSSFKSRFNRMLGGPVKAPTPPIASDSDAHGPEVNLLTPSLPSKDDAGSPGKIALDADKENEKVDINTKQVDASPSMHTPLSKKKGGEKNRRMSPSVQLVLELSRQLDQALQDRINMERALQLKELRMDQMQAQINKFEDRITRLEKLIPENEL